MLNSSDRDAVVAGQANKTTDSGHHRNGTDLFAENYSEDHWREN